jgi:hypothetical protein
VSEDILKRLQACAIAGCSPPERALALEAANEIARLRGERRWVPVGERLPVDEDWVDVAGRWGDCLGWHDGEEWRNVEEDPFPSEVTHWRKRGPGPEANG